MVQKIALLAHPTKIDSIINWLKQYQSYLTSFDLVTTQDLYQSFQQELELKAIPMSYSNDLSLGGDIQIAAAIFQEDIDGLIFFLDHPRLGSDYPDFWVLLRACQTQNIPLALNPASASLMVQSFQHNRIAYLIFNPVAGQRNPNQDLSLIRQFLEPQIMIKVITTQPDLSIEEHTKEIVERIQSQSPEDQARSIVIASGGDGTVSAVAGALINTNLALGVIPRGTANAFAVALGIPTDVRGACQTILGGHTRVIDTARCNDLPMILLAGLGFEAGMVNRADRELKNFLGPLAYILAGAQQLADQKVFSALVELDGAMHELEVAAITIANVAPATSVLAQGFGQVIPDDGLLEVTIATSKTRLDGFNALTSLLTSALVRNPTQHQDLLCLRTKELKIKLELGQMLVIDGEIIETPETIELRSIPSSLRVLTPFQI